MIIMETDMIGKTLKYKFDKEPLQKVVGMRENNILFESGASVAVNKVNALFQEVEMNDQQKLLDMFDDNKYAQESAKSIVSGKSIGKQHIDDLDNNDVQSFVVGVGEVDSNQAWKVSQEALKEAKLKRLQLTQDDNRLLGGNSENDKDFYNEDLDYEQVMNNLQKSKINDIPKNPQNPQKNSLFNVSTMKKTQSVKLKIEMIEKIPDVQALKAFSNLFEGSIIKELAREIGERYLSEPDVFYLLIENQLDNIIFPPRKKKPKKKIQRNVKPITSATDTIA